MTTFHVSKLSLVAAAIQCYDLRFAELSTILRKNGANFLTYPSAFAYSTGVAHWEPLLRARAIENQCYVIAPAQIGFHNAKRQSYGHAMIVDPWGKVLAECDDNVNDVQCKTVTIDTAELIAIRKRMPCFDHRRHDVYALAPIQMALPAESIVENESLGVVEDEQTPHFIFEKYPVPKSTVFYETPMCLAFTNITCVVPGREYLCDSFLSFSHFLMIKHIASLADVLVASRRCVGRLKELNPDEIMNFFMVVCKCQRMLESYYNTTSSTVTVQDGEFAGQTVKVWFSIKKISIHKIESPSPSSSHTKTLIWVCLLETARPLSHHAEKSGRFQTQWWNLYRIE